MESSTTSNNTSSPLKLRWDDLTSQYKVNKPNDQSGEYVDKKIADEMYETLKKINVALCDIPHEDSVTMRIKMRISGVIDKVIAKADGGK